MAEHRVAVLGVSDTRSRGEREDETTAVIVGALEGAGMVVVETALVADEREAIEAELIRLCDEAGCALVLTTGGTGLGPRDVTPEATRAVAPVDVPGLPEAVRVQTSKDFPRAVLSRAVAGLRGSALIVNLPGSPGGVRDALEVLMPVLPHALAVREGHGGGPGHETGGAHGAGSAGASARAAVGPPEGAEAPRSGVPRVEPAPGVSEGENDA